MHRRQQGFTIIELVIAIAVTLIMMTAAMMVYQRSVQVAGVVGTRAEMQSELRAATEQIARDLNQAGTGLQGISIAIPSAATGGADPFLACDATPKCYLPGAKLSSGVLYAITPEDGIGPNTTELTDAIVILYVEPVSNDPSDRNASGTAPNWAAFTTTNISDDGSVITMPPGTTPPLDDPVVGIVLGDMFLVQNSNAAVGIVTTYDATANTITFGTGDPLNINQLSAPVGNIAALKSGSPPAYAAVALHRIDMITYFIQEVDTPNGPDYRLMRQVDARTPTPVAEHIEDLQFTYDVFDPTTDTVTVNLPDAAGKPGEIKKVNITITARSSRPNTQGIYDRLTLTTSVGPQNLSYHEKYN